MDGLVKALSDAPHHLRVVTFSMDDLYLPFKDQSELSQRYPANKLIEFRGLPGTHDIRLGTQTFQALGHANTKAAASATMSIPSYDKALNNGRGDQVPRDQWLHLQGPVDVVLFEGWSLGFKSIRDQAQLEAIRSTATFPPLHLAKHSLESLEWVNEALEEYEREWYPYFDIFVHLSAPNLSTVFQWRAEQERDLWRKKGAGMSEEQVSEFVARFMPAYELYLERLKHESLFRDGADRTPARDASAAGRHLRLDLDEGRDLLSTTLVE
ncbi:hypothetical protein BGW38_006306 [Lunasporangiospora selenospora]|uniref:Uncharacterized protein n=1 Tax=Lunasporangiospora selenospora TaxID=979761 RepID=A0A9P6KB11_9FUNG|nr:hypothetical protein BGW38_006306 [Lunasporangiospora selenospora]